MRLNRSRSRFSWIALFALVLCLQRAIAAEPADPRLEAFRNRPLSAKLRSPRQTIETLCFAMDARERFPKMIHDAVKCLDMDEKDGFQAGTAEILAVELGSILDELSFPFEGTPSGADGKPVTFYEDKEIKIVLERGADGLWRFDRLTVSRIREMRKVMAARTRQRDTLRSQLREKLEDPTATITSFLDYAVTGDFDSAAARLDLQADQRQAQGRLLAWRLANVMQRRGYVYSQSVPVEPDGPPYTWSIDDGGSISVERVHRAGKDSWLFTASTVKAIDALWERDQSRPVDPRYLLLEKVVSLAPKQIPPITEASPAPATVPPHFASPQAMLRAFFAVMDDAEYDDAKLVEARQFLDLSHLTPSEADVRGPKFATMLEIVFRKMKPDLSAVSDKWSAPPQVLTAPGNLRVEVVRQNDGCWRIRSETVARLPAMYDSISGQEKVSNERTQGLGSPRETLVTFFRAVNSGDNVAASRCLDLTDLPISARDNLGPVLAFKLKAVIDRTGRIVLQEISNESDGPRLTLYRGSLGRIVIARREDDASKAWRFTAGTVGHIEAMFDRALDQPVSAALVSSKHIRVDASFWQEPGVWFRTRMPPALRRPALGLQLYQWPGLVLVIIAAGLVAVLVMRAVRPLLARLFPPDKGQASPNLGCGGIGALGFLVFLWVLYHLLVWVDLPSSIAAHIYSLEKLVLTVALVWAAFQVTDLWLLYHQRRRQDDASRGLGELVFPFISRLTKLVIILVGLTYLVYEFGQGDSLKQFLAGLGIAGLAVSLAAQDSLKNLFATMLLIGDRSFRVGDRLKVGDKEGVVEQLGFRSTKLRTPDDSLITLPNSMLAQGVIDNLGLRKYRRVRLSFVAAGDTPLEQVTHLRDGLRDYLATLPTVDPKRSDVNIAGFQDGGIELEVAAYFEACAGQTDKQCREELTCEIVRRAQDTNIQLNGVKD